ncbi:MAG: threonine--tRNA ligase [Cryomorphaceae bacterium]|jgi:threonyl-tRNA synthetase|nr:threonine--tRNA ligase [Cryomorphaceae bacterium]MBT4236864.1 threonine--tRNA ligase [Cryomorphaceae bacterium]MBT4813979.1 threonine--tRNA ligase [Cryomorphaceae bacterium]MBT5416823.1 threonine--tRNA ligase [Cryomorphaceae bacterium]MDA8857100.1 threonine--tRNA ligase [Flavobacteriaceae bacterium]
MISIIFPDSSVKKFDKGTKVIDVAKSISEGLARKVISASFNKETYEIESELHSDGSIKFYTWEDDEGKQAFWHSSAHILAQTIKFFYPNCKLTIGPSIENGFYYDVDFDGDTISEKDFQKIEVKFLEFARLDSQFKMKSIAKKDAIDFYKKESNQYKIELIDTLDDGTITFCDHSDFSDLCKGGHIPSTGIVKAVKLLNIAGAYWRGDEKNNQLTRIYGISFPKQKLLTEYLELIEKAKERDHRKLGKELELFTFSSKVGQGLPLWLPKGTDLRDRLQSFLEDAQKKAGYKKVMSPHIGSKELYITSGHYEKYGEDSFQPIKTPNENEIFMLRPMNCPHHCEIFNAKPLSYRDLPLRLAEFGTVYRYEQSGELHGLSRVRGFTVDDAHIFCSPEQVDSEFKNTIDLVLYVFRSLGFSEFYAQVSLRDPDDPKKYIGSDENWNIAEEAILSAAKEKELNYKVEYGEAAFYGPKLDFMVKDALGRSWQLGTIQVDYNLPERFELTYKGSNNEDLRPVMLHRAPFGSMERFVAILLEHTGGVFPLWLATTQVEILIVSENFKNYGQKVLNILENHEIRAHLDDRNETVGKKIRESEINKIPFMIVVGENEVKNNSISIRRHHGEDLGEMKIEKFVDIIKKEISDCIPEFNIN